MIRLINSRCTGKTTELLRQANKNNGIVACPSLEVEGVASLAKYLGYDKVTIIPYRNIHKQNPDQPIYIDELEMFIKYINKSIVGYSLSLE